MYRRPSMQDITWLLDLNSNNQLNLDPPYQRRSVWTIRDKQFFLDTLFHNYPSPAIFLHKTINEIGKATYHVVDGKQRINTILEFVSDKIKISKEYGDLRLNGKKWSELAGENELKQVFWNYQITVEQIDFEDEIIVREVFDRLNRNARGLKRQELRHAKYDGWFIKTIEKETERNEWLKFGVVTKAKARRMDDCQFISELFLISLENKIIGFDQDTLDDLYAKYDLPNETVPELNEDLAVNKFEEMINYLDAMDDFNESVSNFAKSLAHLHSLCALILLTPDLPAPEVLAKGYVEFMSNILFAELNDKPEQEAPLLLQYRTNAAGASTDLAPRLARFEALKNTLINKAAA